MKNTIDKKGQKQGIWQTQNKSNTLLIEENYKNGVLHGKRIETYKGDLFGERFYMNGQLFGEILRNDKPLIHKFHELVDNGKWKIDKKEYPHSKFWFVGEEYMFEEYIFEYHPLKKHHRLWVKCDGFWSVFESEFAMDFQEIRNFIKQQAEKHFKLKVDVIIRPVLFYVNVVEKHFNGAHKI